MLPEFARRASTTAVSVGAKTNILARSRVTATVGGVHLNRHQRDSILGLELLCLVGSRGRYGTGMHSKTGIRLPIH